MAGERWTFTKSQLDTTPSRKCGIDGDKELTYRQQAANLIQDMGQRLQVTQLCINTAIVYMHRFYMFQSFTKFHRNPMAAACLFLAAKVEEQPRKLEHVIKVSHLCLNRDGPQLDIKSVAYLEQAHELVINENILLQTLGFDLSIDHPHTNVVKTCQLVKASKDLAQTSYFLATNSLHLTTLCLQYKPTVVACVCVHLACKWSNWEIPKSVEGKEWFYYVDKSVTTDLLHDLTQDFLKILDKCPSKLRRKIMTWKSGEKRDIKDEIDAGSEKPSKSGTTGDGTASSSSSAPSGSGTSKSSKPHHHTASSHDHKSEKHPESSHVKQESHGSLVKHSSDHAAATHSSTSGATHTHGKNVFDVLTRDKIKYEKAESQQPSLSRATSAPIVPVVQKTSLAEYKERREREKQAALLNKSANAMETDKKLTIKQEPVSGRSAMLDATETVKKHHDPSEREKVKKSHHDRHHHGRHGVEAVPGSEIKLRIKTEPGVSAESSLRDQDSKTWKTESSSALESLKGPETKLRIKKEPGLIPEEISKGMETKIRKSDLNAMSEGTPKGSDTKLRIKSDPDAYVEGSKGSDMKIRIKKEPSLTQKGSSPLKLKIKTSHLPKEKHHSEKSYSVGSSSSHHSSHSEQRVPPMKLSVHPSKVSSGDESLSKHSGREGHHKPHKSSKHSSHSSSGSGGSSHSGTNGKSELKIHISMSEINRQQGGASDAGKMNKSSKHGRDSDKHKQSSKSQNDISKSELSWTSSESLDVNSELSRKRPHSPSDMLSNDLQQRNKVHKSESTTRLRRSSSNHSVVSMDLSDSGLDGYGGIDNDLSAQGIETNGSGKNSPCVETARKQIQVLQQAIEFQKAQIAAQVHHSSPSGVLLHHQAPPLPQAQPPPPPPPPSTQLFQFSSASQQYGYQPIESLCDIDFLADDTMPPLPGEQPPLPPSPSMQPPPPPY